MESAQAMLMKAQAVFDNAEITYNRQKKLFEENATAKKNLDDATSAYTEAKANVETKSEYVVTVQFQNGALYSQEGKLSFADNKVNSSTGTILVEALFPNPDQVLVPGMYVKVSVKDKEQKPALLIPQSSIQESQLGKFVLVVGADNKVIQRVIKTGIKSGPSIQVVEGLKEGERVVVEGLQKVRLGMPIKPLVDESYSFNSPASTKRILPWSLPFLPISDSMGRGL